MQNGPSNNSNSSNSLNNSSSNNSNKPDHTVDLKGAIIEWCKEDISKRRNVFEVSTILGLTILMQDDSLQISAEWFQEIKEVIEAFDMGGGCVERQGSVIGIGPPTSSTGGRRGLRNNNSGGFRGSVRGGGIATEPTMANGGQQQFEKRKMSGGEGSGSSSQVRKPEQAELVCTRYVISLMGAKCNKKECMLPIHNSKKYSLRISINLLKDDSIAWVGELCFD